MELTLNTEIPFTYTVEWTLSSTKWSMRWDSYLQVPAQTEQVGSEGWGLRSEG